MCPKDADRMANNVDPDQTVSLGAVWVYIVCPDLSVRKLKNITISQWLFKGLLVADGRGFDPRVRRHSFMEIGHEIISTTILSLPLIQVGQVKWCALSTG